MQRREFILTTAAATAVAVTSTLPRNVLAGDSDTDSQGAASSKLHIVEIRQFTFAPTQLRVRSGDRIRWINLDIVPHTATAKDGSWDTATLAHNATAEIVVTDHMSSDYYCRFHPAMVARLKHVP